VKFINLKCWHQGFFFQIFEVGGLRLSVAFTQALILVFGCMPKKYPSSQDATIFKNSILG
jgi:hypothetical protein